MYLKRDIDVDLNNWKNDPDHKPLLIRGIRQCGKTSAVKELSSSFTYYVEINFEQMKSIAKVFNENLDIDMICMQLEALYRTPIIDGETLLFLDEIQVCPDAIRALRYFYEKRQKLHVIAAGSLLEFALEELSDFGVGRIRSIYMYPFSFGEYLSAAGFEALKTMMLQASYTTPLPELIHNQLVSEMKKFIVIGGMPAVVSKYITTKSVVEAHRIITDIVTSFKDDFGKYRKKIPANRIRNMFDFITSRVCNQISFSNSIENMNYSQAKEAFTLLSLAGLVVPIYASSCDALPIDSGVNLKRMKPILIDTGLYLNAKGLDVSEFLLAEDFDSLNKGAIAEMFAGIELIKAQDKYRAASLYYWMQGGRSIAEVDYVIQKNSQIIPIEIKAKKQGGMKSLWSFLEKGKSDYGIRSSLENFGRYENIRIYPLYAISQSVHGESHSPRQS